MLSNTQMATQLQNIALVQMGLPFRSRIETEKEGNVAVIQMRDLTDHRLDNPHNLAAVAMNSVDEHHFVRRKDLVFRSRGKTTTTAIIDFKIGRTIIAAPLLRIRVTNKNVLPEYLCWFINQPSSQAFLHSRVTGTAMAMIGKSVLNALNVSIPNLAHQKKIAALAALSDREQELMAGMAKRRKRLIQGMLIQLAMEYETEHESNMKPHNSLSK